MADGREVLDACFFEVSELPNTVLSESREEIAAAFGSP